MLSATSAIHNNLGHVVHTNAYHSDILTVITSFMSLGATRKAVKEHLNTHTFITLVILALVEAN